MTDAPRKRGRLFYKLLLIFLIVSLVPLGIVGYYLVNLSQITLNRAISRDQEALAVGFADTVSSYIINFRNVLFDAAHLEDFASMNTGKQQALVLPPRRVDREAVEQAAQPERDDAHDAEQDQRRRGQGGDNVADAAPGQGHSPHPAAQRGVPLHLPDRALG